MKRSKFLVTGCGVLAVSGLAGLTTATASNQDTIDVIEQPLSPTATLRHMENAASALAREQDRLSRLVAARPPTYPPDPCADPGSNACRQVHAVETIDAAAESFLASVAALDHGTDQASLVRRLAYSAAALAWTSVRLDGIATDLTAARPAGLPPSQYPPDPCGPSVLTNSELLASAGLDSAAARLDKLAEVGFNPQPDPPGTDVIFNPQPDPPSPVLQAPPEPDRVADAIDAIIARAEYVATRARALKATRVHLSTEQAHLFLP